MNIALGSIFRNAAGYIDRYFAQVMQFEALARFNGHTLRLVLAEGDSSDGTWSKLSGYRLPFDVEVIKREHGGPAFGSVNVDRRWRQISYVCDGVLERVRAEDDLFIYVESDLIWSAEMMLRLIEPLVNGVLGIEAIAPMSMKGKDFYDVWGYRRKGQMFTPAAPHHPDIPLLRANEVMAIDSAGSCIAMRAQVARECRFRPAEHGIVGFCEDMTAHKRFLWLDPHLKVEHP